MLRAMGLEKFNSNKLKPHLKMAEHRFNILCTKKTALIKQQKKEIAELLRMGKEEKARIRVEHLIRLDFTIEAYEVVALLCELLHERVGLVASQKECPIDMKEAVCTLVFAAPRCEVPELHEVSRQLRLKYGKDWADAAKSNAANCVNARVVHKLGVSPPSAYLVIKYLAALAEEHSVEWAPTALEMDAAMSRQSSMPGPSGFSIKMAPGSNLRQAYDEEAAAAEAAEQPPLPPLATTPLPLPLPAKTTPLPPPLATPAPVPIATVISVAHGPLRELDAELDAILGAQHAPEWQAPTAPPHAHRDASDGRTDAPPVPAAPQPAAPVKDEPYDIPAPGFGDDEPNPFVAPKDKASSDYELLQKRLSNLRK